MRNFSFNGITKDYVTALRGSNRIPWAPVEAQYQEIAGRGGAYSFGKKIKPRPLPIPVLIKADSVADLQKVKEDFALWLIQDGPKPLIFDDEPDRTYFAEINGVFDPNEIVDCGQGVIPFICFDPLKYGAETNLAFANDTVSLNIGGTYKTFPRIEASFTAASSEFKILHNQQNKFVRVIKNFIAGDNLIIDFASGKITLNGSVTMPILDWVNSDFFALQPGAQTLNVTPTGVSNTKVFWKPRWL